MKVSLYTDARSKESDYEFDLHQMMEWIKDGEWQDDVKKYRESKVRDDKEKLPAFTGSGTFYIRRDDQLKEHSGHIIIDIDEPKKEEEKKKFDLNKIKKVIAKDRFTSYAFVSCSGNGLAVVIKINPNKHRESFYALHNYYKAEYNIIIDGSCVNESRLRFVSYDPDLIKGKGEVFEITTVNKKRILDIVSKSIINAVTGEKHFRLTKASYLLGGYVASDVMTQDEAIKCLQKAIRETDAEDLNNADKTIIECLNKGKEKPIKSDEVIEYERESEHHNECSKKAYKKALSMLYDGEMYNDNIIDDLCKELLFSTDHCKRIFQKVFTNTEAFGINKKPVVAKLEYFIGKKYTLRKNIITQEIELKNRSEWQQANIDSIYRFIQHIGVKGSLEKIKSLLRSDYIPEYNPFNDYFESLPEWDEQDHILNLAAHIKTDDNDFWNTQFKKALVRSLACSLDGIENRIIMVLVGEKQSTGKSTFIRFLSPFGRKYYTESPIRDNKDTAFALAENFIYNLEELDSLTKMDVSKLKSIISSSTIKERKPYASEFTTAPRRCNFWGSTNKTDFLTDDQNTRWLCFNVASIDWAYKESIDINMIWSQAYYLYKSGYDYSLTKDEQQKRDEMNKSFETVSIEKDAIIRFFEKSDESFCSNSEILETIQAQTGIKSFSQYIISSALSQLGFKRSVKKVNGHTQRGWACQKITLNNVDSTPNPYEPKFNNILNDDEMPF